MSFCNEIMLTLILIESETFFRASIIQQEITKVGRANEESIYKPVLIRGTDGEFRKKNVSYKCF